MPGSQDYHDIMKSVMKSGRKVNVFYRNSYCLCLSISCFAVFDVENLQFCTCRVSF